MFSEMVAELAQGRLPEEGPLRRRFDMALIKKMGVFRLPSAFWTGDPKINPRADHLFWASLLLHDRQRIDLALAVLAAEQTELQRSAAPVREGLAGQARELLQCLFALFEDDRLRETFRRELLQAIPAWLAEDVTGAAEERNGHGD